MICASAPTDPLATANQPPKTTAVRTAASMKTPLMAPVMTWMNVAAWKVVAEIPLVPKTRKNFTLCKCCTSTHLSHLTHSHTGGSSPPPKKKINKTISFQKCCEQIHFNPHNSTTEIVNSKNANEQPIDGLRCRFLSNGQTTRRGINHSNT